MRWLVEVKTLGKTETESLHVDGESWQKALEAARQQRGEFAPMSGFSIELSDEGARAVDSMSRLRYDVRRAPDDAPAVDTGSPVGDPSSTPAPVSDVSSEAPRIQFEATAQPPRPSSQAPRASKRPSLSPSAAAAVLGPAAAGAARPASTPAIPAAAEAMPVVAPGTLAPAPSRTDFGLAVPSQVIFKREEDATDALPLTYREYVFLVPSGTGEKAAEALLLTQLDFVRASLERVSPGKLVNLGVFDAAFHGKPTVPPLSTLTWKDWRGDPIVEFPRRPGYTRRASAPPADVALRIPSTPGADPPSPARVTAAAPLQPVAVPEVAVGAPAAPVAVAMPLVAGPSTPPASVAQPVASVEPAPPVVVAAPVPARAEPVAVATPVVSREPAPPVVVSAPVAAVVTPAPPPLEAPVTGAVAASSPTSAARVPTPKSLPRVPREDLITDLFESMHELHFLRDAVEGGDFCLALAMDKIPSQAGIVHLYDIDRREFLVTSTRGAAASALLLRRHAEGDAILSSAMGKRRAIVLADASRSGAAALDRYATLGGARSLIVAPVILSGRFLGAIELLNPVDGQPYTEAEGNAMTYIAEQFAEFVASHGIVTDPKRISSRVG
jgi:hypothetical protein